MSLTRTLTDRIDALVAEAVERGEAPGIVAGVEIGGEVHVAVAGRLSLGGPGVERDTPFRISSMTKPITAAVVLSLVDDGLLRLDEPVDRLLPELAGRRVLRDPRGSLDDTVPAERSIRVRDLLDFTWGFGQQGALFEGEPWPIVVAARERDLETFGPPHLGPMPDPGTWIARLGELPLMAQPGERWLYHSGSQVLGVLAARAEGRPFDEVLRSRVLEPLGMTSTAFWHAEASRLPTAYFPAGGEFTVYDPPAGEWSRPPAFADGGAGLLSTIDDYLRFGGMLRRGGAPILRRETVAAMTSNHLTPEQRGRVWPGFDILGDDGWGYGLAVRSDGSYGWDGGLGTTWTNLPAHDATIMMLSQRGFDGESYACGGLADLVRAH